jgi:hypothetical protein
MISDRTKFVESRGCERIPNQARLPVSSETTAHPHLRAHETASIACRMVASSVTVFAATIM